MPLNTYKKTVGKGKRVYQRALGTYRKGASVWNGIKKVGGLAMKALAMLNAESKFVDYEDSDQFADTWAAQVLNNLLQGTDAETRIGNDVEFTSLYFKYLIEMDPDAATGGGTGPGAPNNPKANVVRVIVVRDDSPSTNDADLELSDLLEDTTDVYSLFKTGNRHRFKVFHDETHVLVQDTVAVAQYRQVYVDIRKVQKRSMSKCKRGNYITKSTYSSNNGNLGDFESGAYYIAYVSNNEGVNGPHITFKSRMRFIDN